MPERTSFPSEDVRQERAWGRWSPQSGLLAPMVFFVAFVKERMAMSETVREDLRREDDTMLDVLR